MDREIVAYNIKGTYTNAPNEKCPFCNSEIIGHTLDRRRILYECDFMKENNVVIKECSKFDSSLVYEPAIIYFGTE